MKALALLAILLLPASAWAGWAPCPGRAADTGTATAAPKPGKDVCFVSSAAVDPARVDGTACRDGIDVIFNSDTAGANYDATLVVYNCPSTAAQAEPATITDCEQVDQTGAGAVLTGNPVGSLYAIYGISPSWLAFRLANGNSRAVNIQLICH